MRNCENTAFELLLDVMCNTFGAVMFIALALVVIMIRLPEPSDILPAEKVPEPFSVPAEPESNSRLREQLRGAEAVNAELQKELERRRKPQHLPTAAAPEEMSLKMSFHQMKISGEAPFFLLVKEGLVWRVGPDDSGKACEDVRSRESSAGIVCEPLPGKGKALAGIPDLPSGRLPVFVVFPDSAECFFHFRSKLKEQYIRHGIILKDGPEKTFTYAITREGVYEY